MGAAIQVSVAYDLTITGISVLNEMLAPGDLRFAIFSYPDPRLLLLTDPAAFPMDAPNNPTWKDSSAITLTLSGGNEYLLGYVRDVLVNDVGDRVAESEGGVTSDLFVHCINGFQEPTYGFPCIAYIDFGVRLQAVPESSSIALLFCGGTTCGLWVFAKRKKQAALKSLERRRAVTSVVDSVARGNSRL